MPVETDANGDLDRDGTGDEAKPVATDIAVSVRTTKRPANRPTIAGRIFGGLLAFLSLWQVLTPETATGRLLGLVGLVVSALWFVHYPRYLRLLATAALFAWIFVFVRTAPPYVPRHGRKGGVGALHNQVHLWNAMQRQIRVMPRLGWLANSVLKLTKPSLRSGFRSLTLLRWADAMRLYRTTGRCSELSGWREFSSATGSVIFSGRIVSVVIEQAALRSR